MGCQSSESFQEAAGPVLGSVLSALPQRVCLKCVLAVCASSQGHVLRGDTGSALMDLVFWDPPQAAALSLGETEAQRLLDSLPHFPTGRRNP